MLRKIVAAVLAWMAVSAFAAVDVNKADQAQLETVKGVGTSLSTRIVDERKKAPFKDWNDLIGRVPGVGPASAAKLSKEGLTVNGSSYVAAAADKPARKDDAKKPVKAAQKQ